MKLLISGAGGFLASRLIEELNDREAEPGLEVLGFSHSQWDFTDFEQTEQLIQQERPDILLHCGAISDVAVCEKHPDLSYSVNVQGTENVARVCGKYGVRLIFCSSDQVYMGNDSSLPHQEDERLTPPHVYGRHKLLAEEKCFLYQPDSICLRLSLMYDWNTREGAEHGNLVSNVRKALEAGTPIKYPVYDFRSITNVWETIGNIKKILGLPAGVYNFGSENDKCTYEIVKHILGVLKEDERRVERNEEAFADKPRNLRMNISRLNRLGIHLFSTLEGIDQGINPKR